MSEELSKVLDHIEKIGELGDLDDVEPTWHVIAVENALRADEPRPSLPAEIALQSAPEPDMGGFRVQAPGRRRHAHPAAPYAGAAGGRARSRGPARRLPSSGMSYDVLRADHLIR